MGVIVNGLLLSNPQAEDLLPLGIMTPLCTTSYFVSVYLFLISHNDKQMLQQRLEAAKRLENVYDFYGQELKEKESRLRTLRHDFRHLALHLEALGQDGDLEGMLREVRAVSKTGDSIRVTPFCENHTVNAIVSYHFTRAAELGVNCTAQAFVPAKLSIPEAELALIIGNALENCVKGAGPLGEMGYITFQARPTKSYMLFSFSNNYQPDQYAKGRGLGLASIREVSERHEGRMDVEEENGEFRLTV